MTDVIARLENTDTWVIVEHVEGNEAWVHNTDGSDYRIIDKADIVDAWECDCILPSQSCPACRQKAREVYQDA